MSDLNHPIDDLRRTALQDVETSRLLGVDFFPIATANRSIAAADAPDLPVKEPRVSEQTITDRAAALTELDQRHRESCPHCTRQTTHTQTVFGEGNPAAHLMFIGEAPGEEEDRTGRPFVGRAGQKLDEIIKAMGLSREQVYIANVLKSRPPQNRTPLPHEVESCAPFLSEQIRIIQPKAIVALGGPAAKWLLQTDIGITRLRGQWGVYRDGDLEIPVMPTFHPAYLLRNYTVDTRQKVWSDMQESLRILGKSAS